MADETPDPADFVSADRRLQTLEKLAQCCAARRGHFDPPETRQEQVDDLANDLEITCLLSELGVIESEKEPLIWMRQTEYRELRELEQQLAAVTERAEKAEAVAKILRQGRNELA